MIKDKVRIYLLSRLGTLIMRILHATIHWQEVGFDGDNQLWVEGEPRIIAFWHNRQLMMAWPYINHKAKRSKRNMYVLISEHSDGRIIAAIMKCLGIDSIAGSSTHGGSSALKKMAKCIKECHHVSFTPDGPKGPLYKAKAGVLSLAILTGAPVVPMAFATDKFWEIHSWDKMIVPKPFSHGVYITGEPLYFSRDLKGEAFDEALQKIENALMEVTNKADNFLYSS